tara:strand:+ start:249 stop:1040 length:792 start_codon:yes stop_codon:yes gene_type:complete
MPNHVLNQIAQAVKETAPEAITFCVEVATQESEIATRNTGEQAFMARHAIAKAYFAEVSKHEDAIKSLDMKAPQVAESICTDLGVAYATFKNFKQVAELGEETARDSYNTLGFQGSIDCTKKFEHMAPETVNAVCRQVAKDLQLDEIGVHLQPKQGANRHLIKYATQKLVDAQYLDKMANPAESLRDAFTDVLTVPDLVISECKPKTESMKAKYEKALAKIDELETEIETLKAQNATLQEAILTQPEAKPEAKAVPNGEPVAA